MNQEYQWYMQLIKPEWAPPSWLFGPVWTVLYVIIAITFVMVFYKVWKKQWPFSLAIPFALNLVFNFLFTPIQFGLRNNLLAAVDIALVLVTLIWAMRDVYPKDKRITYALIPYLLWVAFATVLQFSVTVLNW
jgi:tryptophan-rich sensory protein